MTPGISASLPGGVRGHVTQIHPTSQLLPLHFYTNIRDPCSALTEQREHLTLSFMRGAGANQEPSVKEGLGLWP